MLCVARLCATWRMKRSCGPSRRMRNGEQESPILEYLGVGRLEPFAQDAAISPAPTPSNPSSACSTPYQRCRKKRDLYSMNTGRDCLMERPDGGGSPVYGRDGRQSSGNILATAKRIPFTRSSIRAIFQERCCSYSLWAITAGLVCCGC